MSEKEDTPMDFARRIRTTARFNPLMDILNDCADVIEEQADRITELEKQIGESKC